MRYSCEKCKKKFEFRDIIYFCPYCGNGLAQSDKAEEEKAKREAEEAAKREAEEVAKREAAEKAKREAAEKASRESESRKAARKDGASDDPLAKIAEQLTAKLAQEVQTELKNAEKETKSDKAEKTAEKAAEAKEPAQKPEPERKRPPRAAGGAIPGRELKLKKKYSAMVSSCVDTINDIACAKVNAIMPGGSLSQYVGNVELIRQSVSSRTALSRIEGFLDTIDNVILTMKENTKENAESRLKAAVNDIDELVRELYSLTGRSYESGKLMHTAESAQIEQTCTKKDIQILYKQVIGAYQKYKRCVNQNGMDAVFPSNLHGSNVLSFSDEYDDDMAQTELDRVEFLNINDAIEYMKENNERKYWGMMNEDYVPHVDVFWRGLEELCSCIDHQVAVKFDEFLLCIDAETATELENDIMSPKFAVDDAKMAKATEFQKKLSEEYQKVINRKKNGDDYYR
ncbi:MAG: cell envelope integrity protein TolA [Lachnospiraceae bacterium]|nr:cell envelope integrity protein TolA [Lachnospiraceae bacterium]